MQTFCCHQDLAALQTSLSFDSVRKYLPASFVLMRKGGACQPIAGRTITTGTLLYALIRSVITVLSFAIDATVW